MRQLKSYNVNRTFESLSKFLPNFKILEPLFLHLRLHFFYYALCKIFELAIAAQV